MPLLQRHSLRKGKPEGLNVALCASLFATALFGSVDAVAQDPARIGKGMEVWERAGCASCHGNDARGGGGGEQPAGPELRRTRLARDRFVETVACGRPGTPMPSNLAGGYIQFACYGLPVGTLPSGVAIGARLTADELDLLVDYVMSLK